MGALLMPSAAIAEDPNKEDIWGEYEPNNHGRWFELTDEGANHILERLKSKDPEKARELMDLKAKDPAKFKEEVGKVMHEYMQDRFAERREMMGKNGMPGMPGVPGKPGAPAAPEMPGMPQMPRMGFERQNVDEYLNWLKKNYPEEGARLAELKEKNPELFNKQLELSARKYGRIARAARDNPELASVLKQEMELKHQREELVKQIAVAKDDGQKKQLIEQLSTVVGNRFDLILKRKQIEYQELQRRLERLKTEIEINQAKIDKWKNPQFKQESVKKHVDELLKGTEEFKWD